MVVTQTGQPQSDLRRGSPYIKAGGAPAAVLFYAGKCPAMIECDIDKYAPAYPAGFRGKEQWLK